MGKKDKKKKATAEGVKADPKNTTVLTKRGWKIVGMGAVIVVIGFIVLSFTDARAENWAGTLSPFLIIGGYTIIGFGIVAKESNSSSPS